MRRTTLLLVGRDKLSRAGLKCLFSESPFTVIGDFSDTAMIDPASVPEPDVALVECSGDSETVLDTLRRMDVIFPDTRTVILNDKVRMATLAACLAAGASGFLTKDISPDALLRSLQLAALGETVFPTYMAGLLAGGVPESRHDGTAEAKSSVLSDREIEAVQCLLRGDSNKLIARRLGITEATIKVHMKSVLRKINASNRTQAAIWAHHHGFLPAHDSALVGDGTDRFDLH